MAWTTPKTWTIGEVVTAANMNIHMRDNLNSTLHLIARKTANQTSTSTTMADDTHLALPVLANEAWFISMYLLMDSPAAADFKAAFTVPAGTTGTWGFVQYDAANGLGWISAPGAATTGSNVGALTAVQTIGTLAPGIMMAVAIHAIIAVAGTAGTVRFQWAQIVASGTTTVFTNSLMMGVRLT